MIGNLVVLELVSDGLPSHCVHGRCTCVACKKWLWLGSETYTIVYTNQALPICRPCVATHLPEAKPSHNAGDHQRKDGPH